MAFSPDKTAFNRDGNFNPSKLVRIVHETPKETDVSICCGVVLKFRDEIARNGCPSGLPSVKL
jgi:hypothetical protein